VPEMLISFPSELYIILLAVNIVSLLLFYSDKRRAETGRFRIPEAALLLLPFFGGALGAFLGMHLFRHKTRHKLFSIGIPILLILQLAAAYFIHIGA